MQLMMLDDRKVPKWRAGRAEFYRRQMSFVEFRFVVEKALDDNIRLTGRQSTRLTKIDQQPTMRLLVSGQRQDCAPACLADRF